MSKKLVSQHTTAEAELAAVEHNVAGLGNTAADLAHGHFDGASIKKQKRCLEAINEVPRVKF